MNEFLKLILQVEIEGMADVSKKLTESARNFALDMTKHMPSVVRDFGKHMSSMVSKTFSSGGALGVTMTGAIAQVFQKSQKVMANVFEKSLNVAMSAMKSPRDALEGITSGIFKFTADITKNFGQKIDELGKKMSQKKGASPMEKMMGNTMRMIGPAVKMMGVLASGVAQLVSMLFDAEAQAKDLNKSMAQSGIAGGDLATSVGNVQDAFDGVRSSATDFFNNLDFGTVAKEQIEIIGAFNEAGFVLSEMTKNTADATQAMKDYQQATTAALTYSKLLGLSTREIATQQAEYMESMGADLQFVSQQFSAVFKQAQLSGFGVKRFYSMVQAATSGMAMYNGRLDEAGGLLIRLGKILGSRVAGDFLQQLNKGFVDESMQDRFKRVMTTGAGKMKEIFENSADDVAFAFGQKFKESGPELAKTLQEAGINVEIEKLTDSGDEGKKARQQMVSQLAKMDPKAQAKMLAKVRLQSPDMARELSKLAKVSEGTKGGLDSMSKAMGGLDMGGTLAAKLAQANAVLGKPLHEMSGMQLAAFENMTGVSGEQREILMEVSQGLSGNFDFLKEQAAAAKEALAQGKTLSQTPEEIRKSVEAYGAYVDSSGNLISAAIVDGQVVNGQQIDNMGEYIQSQGDAIARATAEGVDEDIALARAIASNTTSLATIMEAGVQAVLENIYDALLDFMGMVGLTGGDDFRETRQDRLKKEEEAYRAAQGVRIKLSSELSKKQVEIEKASGEEKAKLQEEANEIAKQIKQKETEMFVHQEKRRAIAAAKSSEDLLKVSAVGDAKQVIEKGGGDGALERVEGRIAKEIQNVQQLSGVTIGGAQQENITSNYMEQVAGQMARQGKSVDEALASLNFDPAGMADAMTAGIPTDILQEAQSLRNARDSDNYTQLFAHGADMLMEQAGLGGKYSKEELNAAVDQLKAIEQLESTMKSAGQATQGMGLFEYQAVQEGGVEAQAAQSLLQSRLTRDLGTRALSGVGKEGAEAQRRKALTSTDMSAMGVADVGGAKSSVLRDMEAAFRAAGGARGGTGALQAVASTKHISLAKQSADQSRSLAAAASSPAEKEKHLANVVAQETEAKRASLLAQKGMAAPEDQEKIEEEITSLLSEEGQRKMLEKERNWLEKFEERMQKKDLSVHDKQRLEQAKEIGKQMQTALRNQDIRNLLSAANLMGDDTVQQLISEGKYEEALAYGRQKIAGGGHSVGGDRLTRVQQMPLYNELFGDGEAQDFIARPGQPLMKFSSADSVMGFKPGGAIDQALFGSAGTGPGGGGSSVVNNNNFDIHITGDTAAIHRTMKQVFKEAGLMGR